MTTARYGIPREKRSRPRGLGERAEDVLAQALTLAGGVLADYTRQYHYAPPRRFAADFAWPSHDLIVEVQGGIWTGKAHGSIAGVVMDNTRLNLASLEGFRVLRFTPDDIEDDKLAETLDVIERVLTLGDRGGLPDEKDDARA